MAPGRFLVEQRIGNLSIITIFRKVSDTKLSSKRINPESTPVLTLEVKRM